MRDMLEIYRRLWLCLLGALALLLAAPGPQVWAQSCPSDNLVITSPAAPTYYLSLAPQAVIHWQSTAPTPSGWQAPVDYLDVYSVGGTTALERFSRVGGMDSDGSAYTDWPANLANTPDGVYEIAAEHYWVSSDGKTTCSTYSPRVTVRVANGGVFTSQRSTADELTHTCSCVCDGVESHSETHPLTGAEDWSIPVTAWYCRGKRYEFALSYDSLSLVDSQAPTPPELTGLSEHNSKWSQPFCQWLDLYNDETGKLYAVWHHDGTYLSFLQSSSLD